MRDATPEQAVADRLFVPDDRQMAGTTDVFETETLSTTERGEDGTLWWQKSVTSATANRPEVEEITWDGHGYDATHSLGGTVERYHVDLDAPTVVDVEAALGARVARGEAKAGQTFTLRFTSLRQGLEEPCGPARELAEAVLANLPPLKG